MSMRKELELQTNRGLQVINEEGLFIIAEVGNQFNGDYDTALRLAAAAKEAGADAVKYIFWFPDEIMAEDREYTYYTVGGVKTESMMKLLNRLRLTVHEWADVKHYCDKIGIIMMSTVNCWGAYQLALDIGLPAIKLSSWDWNYTDLWRWCARTMLPCIADMGPVTEDEIDRNVNIFLEEKNKTLAFLHCFHTDTPEQMNMRNITYLTERYGCLTGYSAAGRDDYLDAVSIGLGGSILEKRLTLSPKGGVLHDAVSKSPKEFSNYVMTMRNLKKAVGVNKLIISDKDKEERVKWFRRIVADEDIGKGFNITRDMLECKRGETGITPERIWDFVGKSATRDIKRNEDIRPEDVSG